MSQESIATLLTVGCIALLVLWIPFVSLVRHCWRAPLLRQRRQSQSGDFTRMDAVSTYLLSGTRHERD